MSMEKWEYPSDYIGADFSEYYVLLGRHRDSDTLARSNFDCALEMLGGESETVVVMAANHWAVGWVESLLIHESDQEHVDQGNEIRKSLDDYPVINEDHWCALEMDEQIESWNDWARSDYESALVKHFEDTAPAVSEALDWDGIDDDKILIIFEDARERANEYWTEEGNSFYIDIDRIVPETNLQALKVALGLAFPPDPNQLPLLPNLPPLPRILWDVGV